jgi:hypothetical protein
MTSGPLPVEILCKAPERHVENTIWKKHFSMALSLQIGWVSESHKISCQQKRPGHLPGLSHGGEAALPGSQ